MTPRILYVEDDILSLRLAQKILRPMNYDFLEATNGLAGIRMAEIAAPDLILMDMNLGDMMGYQVIEYLRQQPRTAKTPIVALTGETSDDIYAKCVAAGCNGYLLKPVNSGNLLRTVRQFLSYGHTAPLI